jgi:hypothetical protein
VLGPPLVAGLYGEAGLANTARASTQLTIFRGLLLYNTILLFADYLVWGGGFPPPLRPHTFLLCTSDFICACFFFIRAPLCFLPFYIPIIRIVSKFYIFLILLPFSYLFLFKRIFLTCPLSLLINFTFLLWCRRHAPSESSFSAYMYRSTKFLFLSLFTSHVKIH